MHRLARQGDLRKNREHTVLPVIALNPNRFRRSGMRGSRLHDAFVVRNLGRRASIVVLLGRFSVRHRRSSAALGIKGWDDDFRLL